MGGSTDISLTRIYCGISKTTRWMDLLKLGPSGMLCHLVLIVQICLDIISSM
jgi:hypothetical protein